MSRKIYPKPTRDVVVAAVLVHGRSRRATSIRFNVPRSTMDRWIKEQLDQQRGECRVLEALPEAS